MTSLRLNARRLDVFNSVFHTTIHSQPTPELDFANPGEPFGGPVPNMVRKSSTPVNSQASWNAAWHVVTSYFTELHKSIGITSESQVWRFQALSIPAPPRDFHHALQDVVAMATSSSRTWEQDDISQWYSRQTQLHFIKVVLQYMMSVSFRLAPNDVLASVVDILERAQAVYFHGLSYLVQQLDHTTPGVSPGYVRGYRQDLHALVEVAVSGRIEHALRPFLIEKISAIFGVSPKSDPSRDIDVDTIRANLLTAIESLYQIGLTGEKTQVILAEVMSNAMTAYIHCTFSKRWASPENSSGPVDRAQSARARRDTLGQGADDVSILPHIINQADPSKCVWDLCDWIETKYSSLVVDILGRLQHGSEITPDDIEKWKEMAIERLARLRINELFDITESWPNAMGALDDLRISINTPQKRLELTDSFGRQLSARLLHAGISTLSILRTYIRMIRSFHSLDHSKVLLDRVAFPLQLYLCSREDTVRIIITGLLSDTKDINGEPIQENGDKLVELARLLNQDQESEETKNPDEELDWDDEDWDPDPVDAGPGYKRSKRADVIGTLIGVLGSPEIFIKEFQQIVGENLLKHDDDFEKELKLLELLKARFGDGPLQSCEVMVRDILTSRELNAHIRSIQSLNPTADEILQAKSAARKLTDEGPVSAEGYLKPSLNAKILSRLFWPTLATDSFKIPTEIAHLQSKYATGFESSKHSRKLTWLNSIGQATVELELGDRYVNHDCTTWQATVIWAFQRTEKDPASLTRTIDNLAEMLEMEEETVRMAVNYWVGKMVLTEVTKDEYAVLETLSRAERERSNAQLAAEAAGTAAGNSDDHGGMGGAGGPMGTKQEVGIGKEKGEMYWQFIQGMLKNSAGKMPVQQIGMMLKMLVIEGFPHSDDDLKMLLNDKVDGGILEMKAGKYMLKK